MAGVSTIARALTVALVSLSLAGCMTTGGGYFSAASSSDAANLNPQAAHAVAGDMVAQLAEHVGPGTGTIALKSDGSAMSAALEEQLRGWGYAVDPSASGQGAIPLAYTVSAYEGQVLTRISTPSVELARSYTITELGAQPASPISVMRRTTT
ncbi:conjugal transfer protein TrbH [Brucella intermedia]|uniref:Conjugal transfer protein TrbH n=1 Tax=Brucella intermedia M86 TaxID=1234597 RepID=M5JT57_9HYPH|nr:conjugal transfer protein TrbH [Brucella intermedia]ELT46639.1 conjugal transfer protein TrbH [Brucella intermedia M86]